MKIDYFKLHCSHCKPESRFVLIPSGDVEVTVDLHRDEYMFKATCPICGANIVNTRRAF